ncbi:MAG: pilin [Candidatus Saccharibacteria bacterium]|nr:pilin [Candidatus Saccharibacteria bacterium]
MSEDEQKMSNIIESRLPHAAADDNYIQNIFNGVYGIAAIVAVAFIIVGAVNYIMSSGDPSKVAKAKNTIMYSVIGLVIVVLASAITAFVIQTVSNAK